MTVVKPSTGGGNGGEPPDLDDDVYPGTIYQVEDSTWPAVESGPFGAKPERPAVIITAVLDDVLNPDGTNVFVDGKFTRSGHENATLAKFAKALLGTKPGVDAFDTDDFVGKRALIETAKNNNGWPRITNISAMPKSMQRQAATAGATN